MKFIQFNFHLYGKLPLVWLLAMVQSFEWVDITIQTLQLISFLVKIFILKNGQSLGDPTSGKIC